MANDLQHCSDCQEEYVAGVTACVECGGALQPGPLERSIPAQRAGRGAARGGVAEQLDRLLVELPGRQADLAVRALLLEDIAVRVVCQGVSKVYPAGDKPAEPFAVTLPVSVYVAAAQLDTAQEILASLQQDDVIGDQWSERPAEQDSDAVGEEESDDESADPGAGIAADGESTVGEPIAESTSLRTVVILVVAGLVLLFLFAR